MQANCTLPTMELIADNSNADSNPKEYLIDRDELFHLRDSGLIQPKLFVYKRNQADLRPRESHLSTFLLSVSSGN